MTRVPTVGADANTWGTVLNDYLATGVVATVGTANGTDDTTAIQAQLTAARTAGGGYVRGTPGQHYTITSGLVIGSGTTLDMTGCTITEPGGIGARLIGNYSFVNPAGTASDAAITSGSNVVTTSLGASAVAGQSVVIAGAGGNGNGVLCGIVASATATTITLQLLRNNMPANASHTVSAAAITLYNRDSNIQIIGGIWNLGTNSPSPYPAILLYHVDNFTADIEGFTATFGSGSRGIGLADVRQFVVRARRITTTSVGMQISGPAHAGRVDWVEGFSTADDLLAITAGDYSANAGLMTGDITDISIGKINAINANGKFLNIIAGAGWLVDGIRVTGSLSGYGTGLGIYVGDDTTDPGTTGGTYGDIDLGIIDADLTVNPSLVLSNPSAARISARVLHNPPGSNPAVLVSGTSTATINELILSGTDTGTSTSFVEVGSAGSTVRELVLDGVVATYSGQTQYGLLVSAGTVSRARFTGGYWSGGAHLVNTNGQTGAITLICDGCQVTGFGRLAQVSTATTAILAGALAAGQSFELFYCAGSSTLALSGGLASGPANGLVARSAAQAISVNSAQLQTDLSLLTPAEGDLCYNTNGALACGTGLAVHHTGGTGNGWKNLYSGSTY